jgi:hypothetical protein
MSQIRADVDEFADQRAGSSFNDSVLSSFGTL